MICIILLTTTNWYMCIAILSLKMDSSHPYKSGEQTYWAYVMPMEDDSYKSKGKNYSAVILKK